MAVTFAETGRVAFEGAVLNVFAREGDTYAAVWDGSKVTAVLLDDGGQFPHAAADIDATEEVRTAAEQWRAERRVAQPATLNRPPREGDWVKVKKGRKVPIGEWGCVHKAGENGYGPWVTFMGTGGDWHITAADNVEVLNV